VSRTHAEHPEFITERALSGNVPREHWIPGDGCFEENYKFYVAHLCDEYVLEACEMQPIGVAEGVWYDHLDFSIPWPS
jgi:hypothetical protein